MSSLFKSIRSGFFGTLLSRVSGLLRDITLAFYFGASSQLALFLVAYRWAFLMRRVVAEGSIQSTYVPLLKKWMCEDAACAKDLHKKVCKQSALIISLFCIALICLLEFAIAPYTSESIQSIIHLTCIMLPVLIFLSLYALAMAYDHCSGKFFRAAASPALFNIIWIFFTILASFFNQFSYILAFGVLAGTIIQWIYLFKRQYKELASTIPVDTSHKNFSITTLFINFGLVTVGIIATQLNSGIDALFALVASLKGPAFLWYALRLQQLPIALVSLSLFSALLPRFSEHKNPSEQGKLFSKATNVALLILIPIVFLTPLIGSESIQLLFQRGSFSSTDTNSTYFCLIAYILGIIPMSINLIYQAHFYAQQNYYPTLKASLSAIGLNLILNTVLIFGLDAPIYYVALSTSLSSVLQMILLVRQAPFDLFSNERIQILVTALFSGTISVLIVRSISFFTSEVLFVKIICITTLYFMIYFSLLFSIIPKLLKDQITSCMRLEKGSSIFSFFLKRIYTKTN